VKNSTSQIYHHGAFKSTIGALSASFATCSSRRSKRNIGISRAAAKASFSGFDRFQWQLEWRKKRSLPRTNIYELWVDRNPHLTGPLFSEIGELVTLESFSVTRCGLEGNIPSEIGQLTFMLQMWLYNNRLTGAVPSP
jgi:hypothetical protein